MAFCLSKLYFYLFSTELSCRVLLTSADQYMNYINAVFLDVSKTVSLIFTMFSSMQNHFSDFQLHKCTKWLHSSNLRHNNIFSLAKISLLSGLPKAKCLYCNSDSIARDKEWILDDGAGLPVLSYRYVVSIFNVGCKYPICIKLVKWQ